MANRYWVGGSGNWDATTTHWSATSGGASGASVPTLSDDVIFDTLSNATLYTVTLLTAPVCASVTVGAPLTGAVTVAGSAAWSIYGSLTIAAAGVTRTFTSAITFAATTTGFTITTNGVALASAITLNGAGGGWTLGSALTTTGSFTLVQGAFDTANFNLSITIFTSTGSTVRAFNFGSSTITLSIGFTVAGSNITNSGTGVINMTRATGKTFSGGGRSYPTLNQGGAGVLFITGANTFANITNTVQPATITFPASTITNVAAFAVSGTAGNLITLNSSTPGTRATLNKTGGAVTANYLSISDSLATPTDTFYAVDSVNVSNNLGWIFEAPVPITIQEYPINLRSFTEPRRF